MDGNLKCRLLSMRGSGMHTILLFDYDFAWISINPGREVRTIRPAYRRPSI